MEWGVRAWAFPSPLGRLDGVLTRPHHQLEVEGGADHRLARRELQARIQRKINHWIRRYAELQLQKQAGKQVRLPAEAVRNVPHSFRLALLINAMDPTVQGR